MNSVYRLLLVCGIAHGAGVLARCAEFDVTAPPAHLKLPAFYTKYVDANGYPVIASQGVNDYALKEAAYLIELMLAQRPDVRAAMVTSGSRMIVMAYSQFTTDIPDYGHLEPKDYWDARARGLGGSLTDPVCSCAEENVLGYRGDPYAAECILIHEFAHNIHLRGLVNIDATFDERLKQTYDAAIAAGLWKDKYASVNHHEYWAEGVQSWFDNNRPPDHDHNHVDTRRELEEYDPGLAKLCREVFGDTELVYTKPHTRLRDHLAGYDPSQAPEFRWPERLQPVRERIRREAQDRGKTAKASGEPIVHEQQTLEGWTIHVDKRLLAGPDVELGRDALRLLANRLYAVALLVPADRLQRLREVPIWLDLDHPFKHLQYHPNAGWLRDHGYDVAMEKSVHVPDARWWIDLQKQNTQPAAILHELAHAYHDRVLGFDYGPITNAFERIKAGGRYESVLHIQGKTQRHYALTNHKEFFAEMTEAFLGTNDFYPFVRAELRDFEPDVFSLLQSIWTEPPAGPKAGANSSGR